MSTAQYEVTLCSVGNPDFRQYRPISIPEKKIVNSLDEASAVCLWYISRWDLGFGNWCGKAGEVRQVGKRGVVARVWYNGVVVDRQEQRIPVDVAQFEHDCRSLARPNAEDPSIKECGRCGRFLFDRDLQ